MVVSALHVKVTEEMIDSVQTKWLNKIYHNNVKSIWIINQNDFLADDEILKLINLIFGEYCQCFEKCSMSVIYDRFIFIFF